MGHNGIGYEVLMNAPQRVLILSVTALLSLLEQHMVIISLLVLCDSNGKSIDEQNKIK